MGRLLVLAIFTVFAVAAADYSGSYEEDYFLDETQPYDTLSVCIDSSGKFYTQESTACDNKVAVGKFKNAINQTGWSFLEIETFDGFAPEIQAYAAGVAEGKLSKVVIYNHIRNTVDGYCDGFDAYCKRLYDYLTKNMQYIRSQLIARPNDIYWQHVNFTLTQMTGILHGYEGKALSPEVSFDITPILMIQLGGELIDLEKALNKVKEEVRRKQPENGKCSGLVKVSEGNKDLFLAQVAMSGFHTMTRVVKLYKFGYDKSKVPGHTASFSGYPAALASSDDFVLLSSGLGSIETTIAIFNKSLYSPELVNPVGQIHCWIRGIVANQLANSAKQWTQIFTRYNSGTYNNQWTVVDYKKFTPGQPLPKKDLMWVLEQVPGTIVARDLTWYLQKNSYWASYNIPFFKKIERLSAFDTESQRIGNWVKFGASPRAKMFKRDHHMVQDMDSLTKLMRYNDYQNDPLSRCNCTPPYTAEAAISARGDLNPVNGTYEIPGMGHRNHGGLDMKGTNYEQMKHLRFRAWGGPTYDPLPPFNWKTTDFPVKHFGMPDEWKFDAVDVEWETPVEVDLE